MARHVELTKNQRQQYVDRIERWQNSPVSFAKEALGIGVCSCGCQLDWQQEAIMNDCRDMIVARQNKSQGEELTEYQEELCKKFGISVKSGKGVGKTATLAMILIWFNFCFGVNVKSLVTAPKADQLKDNLFGEISKWVGHSRRVYGEDSIVDQVMGTQSLKLFRKDNGGKTSWTVGRTCSKSADEATQQATLQGYHDDYQILGADESFGVPTPVFVPVETTMTRQVNFMFLIGNPTKVSGYAYDTFHQYKDMWLTRTINAEESSLVSKDHLDRLRKRYKDSPNMYRVMVQGKFPLDEPDALIPFHKIMDAVERYEELDWNDDRYTKQAIVTGWDIGCGGDLSVGMKVQGIKADVVDKLNERDTQVTGRWICDHSDMLEPDFIGIDGIAWGKGAYDFVRAQGYRATFVDARKKSHHAMYRNLRAELYMKLAKKFINDEIAIPRDEQLIKELSVLKIVNPDGDITKIQIMSKKDMKKNGIESPNYADALMMCMYPSDRSLQSKKESNTRRRLLEEERNGGWESA